MVVRRKKTSKKSPTLGDVIREALPEVEDASWMTPWKRRVLTQVAACGTGLLGWRFGRCRDCGHQEVVGRSCQVRYCSSCGNAKRAEWAAKRSAELLDASYYHLVFTMPGELYGLAYRYQRLIYNLMFACVKETLLEHAKNKRFLGGTPPIFAVLHTTNRELGHHPHIHALIGGIGLDEETGAVVRPKKADYLFPARSLAAGFRRRMLKGIGKLDRQGRFGHDARERASLDGLLRSLWKVNWQVNLRPIVGGAERTIRYLAQYTYRTAISDERIERLEAGHVTYRWTNRKTGNICRRRLPVAEFLKRFQRHILPRGFTRVRMWGALSGTKRGTVLAALKRKAGQLAALRALAEAVVLEQRLCQRCPKCESRRWRQDHEFYPLPRRFPTTLPQPPPIPSWL